MGICLRGIRKTKSNEWTHAYFPALMTCCSMLEYLAGLHAGRLDGLGTRDILAFSRKYLNQAKYGDEVVRILFDAFRNAVAHRGIATGIWVDHHPATGGRRLTWKVSATKQGVPLEVVQEAGTLLMDPPWPCPYTHRVHIRLGRLWRDIAASARSYAADIRRSAQLQENFTRCMLRLYPR